MSNHRTNDWYRRPQQILADIIRKAARGDSERRLWRATVLAVDVEGGRLENPQGAGTLTVVDRQGRSREIQAKVGTENPRGSVKARVLTDGFDRLLDDDDVRTFWPMFPQDQLALPISPGEHVYVMFENGLDHGIWLSRVSGQDSAGSFLGTDSYTATGAPQSAVDAFADNPPDFQTDDESAGLAPKGAGSGPTADGTKFFGGD